MVSAGQAARGQRARCCERGHDRCPGEARAKPFELRERMHRPTVASSQPFVIEAELAHRQRAAARAGTRVDQRHGHSSLDEVTRVSIAGRPDADNTRRTTRSTFGPLRPIPTCATTSAEGGKGDCGNSTPGCALRRGSRSRRLPARGALRDGSRSPARAAAARVRRCGVHAGGRSSPRGGARPPA